MSLFGDPFEGLPRRHYRVIYADPPWRFSSNSKAKPGRNARRHYDTMSLDEIKALPVKELAHPDGCRLMLWATAPFADKAHEVIKAWGFKYKTMRVWVKLWPNADEMFITPSSIARGTGYEVIGNAEPMYIGKRGRPSGPRGKLPSSIIFARRREHSRKPDMVRDEIARLYEGPRLELFARSEHEGFTAWGNQKTRFNTGERNGAEESRSAA